MRFTEQLLPGLIRKPSSIRNSALREELSPVLLQYLDNGSHAVRREFFQLLELATNICGFNMAEQIMTNLITEGRTLDVREIEIVARRTAESNRFEEPHEGPDLTIYDQFLGGVE